MLQSRRKYKKSMKQRLLVTLIHLHSFRFSYHAVLVDDYGSGNVGKELI